MDTPTDDFDIVACGHRALCVLPTDSRSAPHVTQTTRPDTHTHTHSHTHTLCYQFSLPQSTIRKPRTHGTM